MNKPKTKIYSKEGFVQNLMLISKRKADRSIFEAEGLKLIIYMFLNGSIINFRMLCY